MTYILVTSLLQFQNKRIVKLIWIWQRPHAFSPTIWSVNPDNQKTAYCKEWSLVAGWKSHAQATVNELDIYPSPCCIVFVCAVNTEVQGVCRNFVFRPRFNWTILWFYELTTCLYNPLEKTEIIWKKCTTFIDIGRQFPPSWLHFSHRPNDWSSCSRYI